MHFSFKDSARKKTWSTELDDVTDKTFRSAIIMLKVKESQLYGNAVQSDFKKKAK